MTDSVDLTQVETHFAFGENWATFAEKIGEQEIIEAVEGLKALLGKSLEGVRFLDIGCGSGLHSLAASRLGAAKVVSVDIDPKSVATTRAVLASHAESRSHVEQVSVFDMSPKDWGQFDIVYAWGVLHHTGKMHRALRDAAALVRPNGTLAFALYRKTWMCSFWKRVKRWYAGASHEAQDNVRFLYQRLFAIALSLKGMRFERYVQNYRSNRGMDFYHDVHDWLGGYPYESISPAEVDDLMSNLGFRLERAFTRKGSLFGRDLGAFGSGCDEYVYVRSEN